MSLEAQDDTTLLGNTINTSPPWHLSSTAACSPPTGHIGEFAKCGDDMTNNYIAAPLGERVSPFVMFLRFLKDLYVYGPYVLLHCPQPEDSR